MEIIISIVVAVLVIAIAFLVRKFKFSGVISTTADITEYIQSMLVTSGIIKDNSKIDILVDEIVGILEIIAMTSGNATVQDKVNYAIFEFEDSLKYAGIELSEQELQIIKSILTAGFMFVSTFGVYGGKAYIVKLKR